jgi:hypothetical protein
MGIKNAEFVADFESVENVTKKLSTERVMEKNFFLLLLLSAKVLFSAYNFWVKFLQSFRRIQNQHQILYF